MDFNPPSSADFAAADASDAKKKVRETKEMLSEMLELINIVAICTSDHASLMDVKVWITLEKRYNELFYGLQEKLAT